MRKELGLLNLICILIALGFVAMAVISALDSGDFLTIDNLFIITVSLVMALMFGVPVLIEMYSRGRLPIPFLKRNLVKPPLWDAISSQHSTAVKATEPPLLDAKGRAVPPDVKAIMARLNQSEAKDA
jgi:hypothetical protein